MAKETGSQIASWSWNYPSRFSGNICQIKISRGVGIPDFEKNNSNFQILFVGNLAGGYDWFPTEEDLRFVVLEFRVTRSGPVRWWDPYHRNNQAIAKKITLAILKKIAQSWAPMIIPPGNVLFLDEKHIYASPEGIKMARCGVKSIETCALKGQGVVYQSLFFR